MSLPRGHRVRWSYTEEEELWWMWISSWSVSFLTDVLAPDLLVCKLVYQTMLLCSHPYTFLCNTLLSVYLLPHDCPLFPPFTFTHCLALSWSLEPFLALIDNSLLHIELGTCILTYFSMRSDWIGKALPFLCWTTQCICLSVVSWGRSQGSCEVTSGGQQFLPSWRAMSGWGV